VTEAKRTLIEHNGHEFELPYQHTLELKDVDVGEGRTETWVNLNAPMQGSTFHLREREERDDGTVVIHLGGEIGRHGPPSVGEGPPIDLRGYPFPQS
jgi:hypothetical protein